MSSEFSQIRPLAAELSALERLKKSPWTYNGKMMSMHLMINFVIWLPGERLLPFGLLVLCFFTFGSKNVFLINDLILQANLAIIGCLFKT